MTSKNLDYSEFRTQKEILLDYLQVMIAIQDWHVDRDWETIAGLSFSLSG